MNGSQEYVPNHTEKSPHPGTAFVHDWLITWRGGERVLQALVETYPPEKIFTLIYDRDLTKTYFPNIPIHASFLHHLPFAKKWFRLFFPFFPLIVESWSFDDYDLVISTSHCVAKGIITGPWTYHVSYIHTPMRYVWDQRKAYKRTSVVYRYLEWFVGPALRRWDSHSAHRVDLFVANSSLVARRISKYYRRPALILHPPVDTHFFRPDPSMEREHFLMVSALVPYKNIEPVLDVFRTHRQFTLILVGEGPLRNRIASQLPENVTLLSSISDEELRSLYQKSFALIHLAEEDFGMVTAEALACGTPVIIHARSGAADIVNPGVNGFLLQEPFVQTLPAVLQEVVTREWDPNELALSVSRLDRARFQKNFDRIIHTGKEMFMNGARDHETIRVLVEFLQNSD